MNQTSGLYEDFAKLQKRWTLSEEFRSTIPAASPYGLRVLPSLSYYKWWYFDVQTAHDDLITVVFHENHMFCCHNKPSVSVSFYDKSEGWEKFYDSASYDRDHINMNETGIEIGPNSVCLKGNTTRVGIALPEVTGSLRVRGGWNEEEAFHRLALDGTPSHIWKPILLGQEVSGELCIGEKRIKFEGRCYHDSNHGDGYLGNVLAGWVWGRFYFKELSFAYLINHPQKNSWRGNILLCQRGRGPEVLNAVRTTLSGETLHPATRSKYYTCQRIEAESKETRFQSEIQYLGLIDAKTKEAFNGFEQTSMAYYRMSAVANVVIDCEGGRKTFQHTGLTEQMHF